MHLLNKISLYKGIDFHHYLSTLLRALPLWRFKQSRRVQVERKISYFGLC